MVLQKLKRYGVPQSDVVYYYEAVIRPVMEYARQVRHTSLTSEQSKTLEAIQRQACQIIIGGSTHSSNSSSLKMNILCVDSKPKNCSIRSSTSRNTAYITCYRLQEDSLSLIVSDLPTNCRACLQRLTNGFKNSFICYSLNSLQCE